MPAASSHRGQVLSTADVSPPEEYFRGVSPLCRRMLDDMTAVREAWGDGWHRLSYQQQCRVIDQAIVDEATVRRYEVWGEAGPECEYFPKLKLPTGQKVVCDENLTARGFSCSWRDEHSAPFSWHTRSQMDLTLDTPPATPSHPSTPVEAPPTSVEGEGRVIPGGRAVYTARPLSLPRPPRFRWHYDPPDDPPDPPSVVVAAPRSATLPTDLNSRSKRSPACSKYMLVRGKGEEGEGTGLLARIRGAVAALTATCLPLRASLGQTSLLSHNRQHEAGVPDLPPAHTQEPQHLKSQVDERPRSTPRTCRTPGDGRAEEGTRSLSGLSPDPAMVGYVCSLPDDDDDTPYTAARPARDTHSPAADQSASTSTRPPTVSHTPMHVHVSLITSDPKATTHTATHVEDRPQVGTTQCIPLPADLPTPLPTPTITDATRTVSTTVPLPAPPQPSPAPLARHHDAPSLMSEPDSNTDAVDTPREEQPLLHERQALQSEDESEEMYTSILSTKSESNIPKTGFDFLDNW
ncbi:uncharacterized protein [Panulirus ornatus]|uniref:uncharacterized protein n=1 Tax=Panulirus ornatus TaxID=150431 RepID=UPI003A84F700